MGVESVESSHLELALPEARTRRRRDIHPGDRRFSWVLRIPSYSLIALLISIATFLTYFAWPAIHQFGWSFLTTSVWDPVREIFGALPVIYGTVISSLLAIVIATPLSIGVALFLNELAPRRISGVIGFLV